MAKVIENIQIDKTYYLLKTDLKMDNVLPGQFFMLRAWDKYPVLSRPVSIYDATENLEFLYEVVGQGTEIFKNLKPGDEIKVEGPYGNSFNTDNIKEVSFVAGGVGTAPFYYLSKEIKRKNPKAVIDFYIGERENQEIERAFTDLDVNLKIKKGGFITDILEFDKKLIYTCGPDIMMKNVTKLGIKNGCEVYVSLDKRMGCGLGACLSCSVKTVNGNKRACKDGPVFKGADIIEYR